MITPIKTLTINQICERKDDLLVSNEDIKKLSKYSREQAIDEFRERIKTWCSVTFVGCETVILSTAELDKLAEQTKGGVK